MPDILFKLFQGAENILPFCVAGTNNTPKLNIAKIGESLITAGLIAFFCWYVFVEKELAEIKKDIKGIATDNGRIEMKVDKIYNDIYKPVIVGG